MPSYSLYVQLLWYPMYYPEGMKARVSPVQGLKPYSILAPIQDSNPGGRIQNHKRWTLRTLPLHALPRDERNKMKWTSHIVAICSFRSLVSDLCPPCSSRWTLLNSGQWTKEIQTDSQHTSTKSWHCIHNILSINQSINHSSCHCSFTYF